MDTFWQRSLLMSVKCSVIPITQKRLLLERENALAGCSSVRQQATMGALSHGNIKTQVLSLSLLCDTKQRQWQFLFEHQRKRWGEFNK
jgi:hypothetical protein